MFMNDLKETLNEDFNTSITENGAIGYRTTGKELLDINFAVASMRSMSEQQIVYKFVKAFYEDKLLLNGSFMPEIAVKVLGKEDYLEFV